SGKARGTDESRRGGVEPLEILRVEHDTCGITVPPFDSDRAPVREHSSSFPPSLSSNRAQNGRRARVFNTCAGAAPPFALLWIGLAPNNKRCRSVIREGCGIARENIAPTGTNICSCGIDVLEHSSRDPAVRFRNLRRTQLTRHA